MSDLDPKKSHVLRKSFAIIIALLVLSIIALALFVSQMNSPGNSAEHDAAVAEFLRTSTPDMTAEQQQAFIDTIQESDVAPATPEQEESAVNALLGN